jgi:hypothetical protein
MFRRQSSLIRRRNRRATAVLAVAAAAGLTLVAPGVASAATGSSCETRVPFPAKGFHRPLTIDNKFLPMRTGAQLTLTGTVSGSGGTQPHQIVFTVTDLTKVIDGVVTRVILDVDSDQGQVQEAELSFFAQDDGGTVWNLGEYPEEYENGVFVDAPNTWISGLAGAKAGVHMLAAPKVGTPEYEQGRAPRIDFLDCAQVTKRGSRVCVPVKCYDGVLTTRERSPLDPDSGAQTKDHAPGVGIVRVGAVNDPQAETLVLTKVAQLTPGQLTTVRNRAVKLDVRGHRVSAVYAKTPAVKRAG